MGRPKSLLSSSPRLHPHEITLFGQTDSFVNHRIWVLRGQNHDLEGARKLFDEMPERNVESWNAIVAGMIHLELYEEGLGLFLEMLGSGFSPDCFTLGSVIRGCAGLEALPFGKQVQGYAIKIGLEVHLVVGSALAHMYTRCKSLEDGERVIREMPVQNVVAYNTLIGGRYQNGNPEGAFHLYKLMKTAGFLPDEITFVNMISSCSELTTLGQGQQIHAEVIKSGAALNVPVTSSLISMYSRCGDMECSEKAFMENPQKDCVLSSSMIAAYGFHGQGKKAIAVFEQMTEEEGLLEVNEVTFLSLLYACSHSGLRDQGTEFFDLMVNKYGLDPKLEHYTCMVDLLGRSGRLQEAEDMIRSMPVEVEADVIIWKTLLSACRIHKNAIMAGKVAGEIRRLDPQDSASYVLLASIHASGKRWSEVSSLRKAMKERKVKKEPGISWFEYKNTVYQFIAGGDKSHPNWGKIEVYMKELMSEMKKKGYVPDTSSVYHDLDKEEMESNLIHHSEKLAIAFALIIIPPNLPIRVMKNLRVCDDCHGAIKLISEIRQREIIVRDATRFHHFKNGRCSCGDYW
ncbi:hypothetical protein Dimus_019881 [Dionaea muscipula]